MSEPDELPYVLRLRWDRYAAPSSPTTAEALGAGEWPERLATLADGEHPRRPRWTPVDPLRWAASDVVAMWHHDVGVPGDALGAFAPHLERAWATRSTLDPNDRAELLRVLVILRCTGLFPALDGAARALAEELTPQKKSVHAHARPAVGWAGLFAGDFDAPGTWAGCGKRLRRYPVGEIAPFDPKRSLKLLATACGGAGSLADARPALEAFVDAYPRHVATRSVPHDALLFGVGAFHVHVEGGTFETVPAALRRERADAVARAAAHPSEVSGASGRAGKPAPRPRLPAGPFAGFRDALAAYEPVIREASRSTLFHSAHDARYGVVAAQGTHPRMAHLGLMGQLRTPPALTSHLELAADLLQKALKPFRKLDGDRGRSAVEPFTLREVIRAFDVPRPSDRAYPGDAWVDAFLAYAGPIGEAQRRTGILATLAVHGPGALDRVGAGTWWGSEPLAELEGDDPGLEACRRFARAIDAGAADTERAGAALVAAIPASRTLRLVDAVWVARAVTVHRLGRPPEAAGAWLRERALATG